MTQINLQGYSSFGRAIGEIGNLDNTWQIGQELSYTLSNHNFRLGADLDYCREWHLNDNSAALGNLQFDPVFTAQLARNEQGQLFPEPNTGDAWGDFLLGIPISGQVSGIPGVHWRLSRTGSCCGRRCSTLGTTRS
jgi:hypothetical protein